MPVDDWELEVRRRKFAQICAAQAADPERMQELTTLLAERKELFADALALLGRLAEDGDLESFKSQLDLWARQSATGFGGFGAMFLNQLVKVAPDQQELTRILVRRRPATGHAAGGCGPDR